MRRLRIPEPANVGLCQFAPVPLDYLLITFKTSVPKSELCPLSLRWDLGGWGLQDQEFSF